MTCTVVLDRPPNYDNLWQCYKVDAECHDKHWDSGAAEIAKHRFQLVVFAGNHLSFLETVF